MVYLVLSSEAAPYQQAADSLAHSLNKQDVKTRMFIAGKLVQLAPDFAADFPENALWVAIGSRAAALLYGDLPVHTSLVYCMVANPGKIGLLGSRDNVAGVSVTKPIEEQFGIIQKVLPNLRTIALLYRSSSMKSMQTLVDVKVHLPATWKLEAVDVDKEESMAAAISEIFSRNPDLIWTMADSSIYNRATVNSLLLTSLRQKVPVFGFSGSFVKAGALLGLDANPTLQGEYAASLVLERMLGRSFESELLSSGVTIAVNQVVADRLGILLSPAFIGTP
jgi:putative ABC transport system substrate-binding protein